MKKINNPSNSFVAKGVASAAIIAAMLAPATASQALAEEATSQNPEEGVNTVKEDEAIPTTFKDAQKQYNDDKAALDKAASEKTTKLDTLKEAELALQQKDEANTKAYNEAKNAFASVKDKAAEAVKDADNALTEATQNKADKEAALKNNTTELENANKAKDEAQTTYDTLKKEADAQGKSQLLTDTENALNEAVKDVETNQKNFDKAQASKNEADTAHNNAVVAKDDLNNSIQNSKKDVEDLKTAAGLAEEKSTKATEAYENFIKGDNKAALENAEQELREANTVADKIQENIDHEQEEYVKKVKERDRARDVLKSAQSKLQNANAEVEKSEKKVKDLEVQSAQKESESSRLELAVNNAILDEKNAETELANAQNKLNEKNKQVKTLEGEKKQAEVELAKAQKTSTATPDNSEDLKQGAFAFFKSLADKGDKDAQQALLILTKANHHDAVRKGNPLSATAYDNMLESLDFIDEGNKIRRRSEVNQPTLTVSHSLMAMAMVNADWCTENQKHSLQHIKAYYSNENLSWGYPDPYVGWYDEEKQIYDEAVANGEFDPKDINSFWVWKDKPSAHPQVANSGETNGSRVGHYVTLAGKTMTYHGTGFAISKLPAVFDGFNYDPVHVQEFASQSVLDGKGNVAEAIDHTPLVKQHTYTTDEYRELLTQWKDSLTGANDPAVVAAKRVLEETTNKLQQAKDEAVALEQKVNSEKTNVQNKKNERKAAENNKIAADRELQNINQSISSAKDELQEAKDYANRANQIVSEADTKASAAQNEFDTQAQKTKTARDKLTNAMQDIKAKENALKDLKSEAVAFEKKSDDLRAAMNTARAEQAEANRKVNEEVAHLADLQTKLTSAEDEVVRTNTLATDASAALERAKASLETAQNDKASKQAAYDAVAQDLRDLIDAKKKLDNANQQVVEAAAAVQSAQDELTAANNALQTAQTTKDAADAEKAKVDTYVFNGVDTAPVQDADLNAKIDALKTAKAEFETAQASHESAKTDAEVVKTTYNDALAELAKSKIILDSFTVQIIEGAGQRVVIGDPLKFRLDRDPVGFKEAKIDGKIIPGDKYTVVAGSTIVTFNKDVSDVLTLGAHEFAAVYENGAHAETLFSVVAKSAPVITADTQTSAPSGEAKPSTGQDAASKATSESESTPTTVGQKTDNSSVQTQSKQAATTPAAGAPKARHFAAKAQTPATADTGIFASLATFASGIATLGFAKSSRKDK